MIREPSFLVLANPGQEYHPMQMNFLGKNKDYKSMKHRLCCKDCDEVPFK